MSLTTRFASLFDSRIRSRGNSYYREGAVRITQGDERSVRARVRGILNYTVLLAIEGDKFSVSCTCPYFDDDVCKHVWATMLAAEAEGYLYGSAHEPTRLRMANAARDEDDEDFFDEEDDDYGQEYEDVGYRPHARPAPWQRQQQPSKGHWRQHTAAVGQAMKRSLNQEHDAWPASRELFYVVDSALTLSGEGIVIELAFRERKKNGEWGKLKAQGVSLANIPRLPDPADREIISLLSGAKNYYDSNSAHTPQARFRLFHPLEETLFPKMCGTGRCLLRLSQDEVTQLEWDGGSAWEFWLEINRGKINAQYVITGSLRRESRRELSEFALLANGSLAFDLGAVARLNDFGAFAWVSLLRRQGALYIPAEQVNKFMEDLLAMPRLPRLDLPEELRYEEVPVAPRPRLKVREAERTYWKADLRGDLSFDYEGEVIDSRDERRGIFQPDRRRLILRDEHAERLAAERLKQVGFRNGYSYGERRAVLELAPANLPRVVRLLVRDGWHVEAEGKLYRQPGEFQIDVTSGIDWFELRGKVEFGDMTASFPELLAALKRGDNTVVLDDGTFGLLPEEWLKKYGMLAGLGKAEGDSLRFTRSQVGLLDALLASQPEASFDATFARVRDELQRFEGVKAVDPPAGFVGRLRGYQREGLGWLYFLQQFGFGGCLADDMGLGKTIEALALLESRRELRGSNGPGRAARGQGDSARAGKKGEKQRARKKNGAPVAAPPSLVVVPRSLVFNWKQEAARFTPSLRVLDHTGADRLKTCDHFYDHDVVITTYGTLRRDAIQFKDFQFDYVILDEAQAIKNASTEASKAARLLRGDHKLALSGTPVENHLGELWSLFDFLNPGLLGAASTFKMNGAAARNPDEHTRGLLARALKPFILRRTKEQVAKELPPKLEQTIYCEMASAQRRQYEELRDHYRRVLLGLVDKKGINRAKIQILEALLRLRQAACHPGLIDRKRIDEPCAKLDVLLPQLAEVAEEKHKALVFSQFTSLLAIVRDRLDRDNVAYEYLDGRTRDRRSKVERFQSDPDCRIFLVSLKAGGLGLNLTAAEYVFLLDPWWNPAVEAQAIDRAHRIGQTRQVFAYRLIARDTVEEKVLELQNSKRDLANAIINADNSLIRSLAREDLELLLS
jgi:superfamily II DNA or RNA helicase